VENKKNWILFSNLCQKSIHRCYKWLDSHNFCTKMPSVSY